MIGSGPAGLGCAHDLALLGYEVSGKPLPTPPLPASAGRIPGEKELRGRLLAENPGLRALDEKYRFGAVLLDHGRGSVRHWSRFC